MITVAVTASHFSAAVLSLEKACLLHPRCIYNPRWVCRSWCHPNTTSLFHFWSCCCWWRRRIRKISALWRGVVWLLLRNKSTASNLYRKFETITYLKKKTFSKMIFRSECLCKDRSGKWTHRVRQHCLIFVFVGQLCLRKSWMNCVCMLTDDVMSMATGKTTMWSQGSHQGGPGVALPIPQNLLAPPVACPGKAVLFW